MRAPDFWNRRGGLAALLSPLGRLYGQSVARKAAHANPWRAQVPVICVGNLTAGGSGKTPVALAIAKAITARGHKVFFLTRGYGGSAPGPVLVQKQSAKLVGDEALLLADVAPTILSADRPKGAALAQELGAEVIVMDDGHQNFTLAKTVSVVVLGDLGNGRMIPAGPLREPVEQGLARADVVVAMEGAPAVAFDGPLLHAHLAVKENSLAGKPVFAFAGIGRPEKFLTSLMEARAIITGSRFFADHHPFRNAELAALRRAAAGSQLVTTAKDHVRLTPHQRDGIAVLDVEAVFDETNWLDKLLPESLR